MTKKEHSMRQSKNIDQDSLSVEEIRKLPRIQIKGNIQWYFIAEYLSLLQQNIGIDDKLFNNNLKKLIEYAQDKMQLPDGDIISTYIIYEIISSIKKKF